MTRTWRRVRPTRALSIAALAIGLTILIGGWLLGIEWLRSFVPGQATMKVNTALAIVALASAVLLCERGAPARLATALTLGVLLVAAVTLGEYVTGADIGIDNAIVVDRSAPYPGRMSPVTATALIGISLALLVGARARRVTATLAMIAMALAGLNLLDVIFEARIPVFLESYTKMAVTTAIAVGCLALAALIRAAPKSLTVVADPGPGGVLARRLIVAAVAAPIALGWIRLLGQDLGLYETRFGVTLYGVGMMAVMLAVVLTTAVAIQRTDAARADATRAAEQLAAVARNADVAIIGRSLDGVVESWNVAAERLYGYSAAEMVGHQLDSITPPGLAEEAAAILADARNGIGTDRLETVRTHRDGHFVHVLLTVSPVLDATGGVIGIAHVAINITERKTLEAERVRSERRMAQILAAAPDGVAGIARDGSILFANEEMARLFAYERDALVGLNVDTLVGGDQRDRHGQNRRQYAASPTPRPMGSGLVVLGRRRDGTEFPADIALGPVRDPEDAITVITVRDATARKAAEAERDALARELERSNRELQSFAAIASHDLQEPLRKIQAFGDRLGERYEPVLGEQGRDYLARMRGAAVRMQTLIHDLLAYSRVTTTPVTTVTTDLGLVVAEVMVDLETAIEQAGGVVRVRPLPAVDGDPVQMRQLFQNLIGNALKYRRAHVAPEVMVAAEPITAPGSPAAGGGVLFWRITVTDNGIGFDVKHAERIFTPFERLHGRTAYEGTGIGLAICKRIVERAGGSIAATSVPGEGSTFTITLRAARGERRAAA